jgi:transposase
MRASLSQEASRLSSRIQKVLEDANIKLASVATNALGKSGRAMLEDIISGEDDPEHLASLAMGHLRVRIPQLRLALEGKIRSHHRFLLRRLLDQIQFVDTKLHYSKNAWRTSAGKGRSCRKRWLAGTRYQASIEWQHGLF